MMIRTIAATLVVACPGGLGVAQAQESLIPLTNDFALSVLTDEGSRTVTVSLSWLGEDTISVTVGNAGFTASDAKYVKLCPDCASVHFLSVWDASSTYGATTGIVAWPNGPWWSMSILPLSRPVVEDTDGSGVFDLLDYRVVDGRVVADRYLFNEGLTAKAE